MVFLSLKYFTGTPTSPILNPLNFKSKIADIKNLGGPEAGAITAGKFLECFTNDPYIHLDIAGPAWLGAASHYRTQGGSGIGVRLMYTFFKNKCS